MNIWLISPYHVGSHRAWARGYQRHSRHQITILSMPGRFWKWRMQGGAAELAGQARQLIGAEQMPDAILATDMLNVATWLGLLRRELPPDLPLLLYMHENQLTYPLQEGERLDYTYCMINWFSQLLADRVLFNSGYHLDSWFGALPNFLKNYPDYNHAALVDEVRARSLVAPVGIVCESLLAPPEGVPIESPADPAFAVAPLILWNQRWEYDKRPDRFFRLLYRLQAAQIPFRLAVAGKNFRNQPDEFDEAQERLAGHIVHWGFLKSRRDYMDLLHQADLVVSTADHEFFGISILEAVCAGAFPLLPNRLSYPELVPDALHPACLYCNEDELFEMAALRLENPRPAPPSLRAHIVEQYDWPVVARKYDDLVHTAVNRQLSRQDSTF